MSAELADPFAPQRLKVADMREDIRVRVYESQYDDPDLCPQLVAKTLHELGRAAEVEGELGQWSRSLLEHLHHRAVSGVSYRDEPCEPAWSLDPDPRVMPTKDRS